MPVSFLTAAQRESYGRFAGTPTADERGRYFHLDDDDRKLIAQKRGESNRLGFALQLTTVRFLGRFLDDPMSLPHTVIHAVARQLHITNLDCLVSYQDKRQRLIHVEEICARYGYREFGNADTAFRLTRWVYALCWTGTERPSVLFDRATAWMLAHKVLLEGASLLERFVAKLRSRVEARLWRILCKAITPEGRSRLEDLLRVPEGGRNSWLDRLRRGPVRVSAPALVRAIDRLQSVRDLGIKLPTTAHIPPSRLASLARFANNAKVTAVARLPSARRLATLIAFVHSLEAIAHEDALEVLDMLLQDLFGAAMQADKRARLRSLKDLDSAAITLAEACHFLLDPALPDSELRTAVFTRIPPNMLAQALGDVGALTRPPDDVFYKELVARYRSVRRFLPTVLKHIRFGANSCGEPVVKALDYLRLREMKQLGKDAPLAVVSKPWRGHVLLEDGSVDPRAYTFCALDELRTAIRRRDVFVSPSWRYADPRIGLLTGGEWDTVRPIICRTLGFTSDPAPVLSALAQELDQTYRAVAARLPNNSAVRFETVDGRKELVLSHFDKLEEPPSLLALRDAVATRLPQRCRLWAFPTPGLPI